MPGFRRYHCNCRRKTYRRHSRENDHHDWLHNQRHTITGAFMKKRMSILTIILSGALFVAWKVFLPRSEASKFQLGKGPMWNGGKPSLPVRIDRSGNALVVDVLRGCESFQVSLRTEGLELKTEGTMSQLCRDGHRMVLPLSVDVPEAGRGYLIAEVTIRNQEEVQSMTKSFPYEGTRSKPIFFKPTSVDQNGVRYHEFKTSSVH